MKQELPMQVQIKNLLNMKLYSIIHHKLSRAGIAFALWLFTTGAVISDSAGDTGNNCLAHIEVEQEDQTTRFSGVLKNNTNQTIEADYMMETIKEGASGRSTSRQGGSAVAAKGEQVVLSTTQINIADQDDYIIILRIFSGDQTLCADTLIQGNKNDLNKIKN